MIKRTESTPVRLSALCPMSAKVAEFTQSKPTTTRRRRLWVASWVDYLSLLQLALYASYLIPLKFSSYGPGMAVNSRWSSSPCSSHSSMSSAIPLVPCCNIHETFNSILVGILLYNYYLCVTTDPGGVPDGWVRHGPSSMTISTYICVFRGQNSMTQKATKSRS